MSAMTFDDDSSDRYENDDGSCVALTITGRKSIVGRSRSRTPLVDRRPLSISWGRPAVTDPDEGLLIYI